MHSSVQPPTEDIAYKEGFKNYFYLKTGFIDVSLTGICRFSVKIMQETKSGVYAKITNHKIDL